MNSNDIVENLNSIRTVAVQVQTFIHGVCGKITDSMKLYDLKLKEIKVLDKKIKEEKARLLTARPHQNPSKKHKLKAKTKKLKAKLHQEKAHVAHTVKKVAGQHNNLIVNNGITIESCSGI